MTAWTRNGSRAKELNLPAFVIAMVITAILVVGIKESARFNATIVVIKVAVVLFVIGLGIHYVNSSNWGTDWHSFAPFGFSGIGAGAGMRHPFMAAIADALAAHDIATLRYEFPGRAAGRARPDSPAVATATVRAVSSAAAAP